MNNSILTYHSFILLLEKRRCQKCTDQSIIHSNRRDIGRFGTPPIVSILTQAQFYACPIERACYTISYLISELLFHTIICLKSLLRNLYDTLFLLIVGLTPILISRASSSFHCHLSRHYPHKPQSQVSSSTSFCTSLACSFTSSSFASMLWSGW